MGKLKVLFDWDTPDVDAFWCIKRGIKLFFFGCCNLFHIHPFFFRDMYEETDSYAIAITELNELLDVDTVYGITDDVAKEKKVLIDYLKSSGKDIHRHIHVGKYGFNRKRVWYPPLNQPKKTWHYDTDWMKGNRVPLEDGELPIWHIDARYLFEVYIDFLYENLKEKKKD
jgi:hypothetical protein